MSKGDHNNYYFYNKSLTERARKLRANLTKGEACLWKYVLKARQMKGYSFRRQRPVMNYIADFLCKELMLIIEVDGFSHNHEEAERYDQKRDEALRGAGFRVLRFGNQEVLNHINVVKSQIEGWIDENTLPSP